MPVSVLNQSKNIVARINLCFIGKSFRIFSKNYGLEGGRSSSSNIGCCELPSVEAALGKVSSGVSLEVFTFFSAADKSFIKGISGLSGNDFGKASISDCNSSLGPLSFILQRIFN